MQVDAELLLKIGSIVIAILGIWKLFLEVGNWNKSKLREEYSFAKDFFAELKAQPDMHSFVKEKGYQALSSSDYFTLEEATYLLSFDHPAQMLRRYVAAKDYLHFDINNSLEPIQFTGWHRHKVWRKITLWGYVAFYVIFSFLAAAPLILLQYFSSLGQAVTTLFTTLPIFGFCAYLFLRIAYQTIAAEKVIEKQIDRNRKTDRSG